MTETAWTICGSVLISEDDIDAFAALTGDTFAPHMSAHAARAQGHPARVAHGLLVLSRIAGLIRQSHPPADPDSAPGWRWRFRAPVYAGDRVTVRVGPAVPGGVAEAWERAVEVFNQHGTRVQSGTLRL